MPARPTFTTVLLVRHGVTATTGIILPGRAPGLHLSERGLAQAEHVAERLGELSKKPIALYVSPLERTRETAAPIARALRLRAHAERGLLECDFGLWTGKKLNLLAKKPEWRAVQNAPSITMDPDSGLPRSVATVVAGTRCTTTSSRTPAVKVVSFTSTRPPGRSLASTAGQ